MQNLYQRKELPVCGVCVSVSVICVSPFSVPIEVERGGEDLHCM